MNSFAVNSAHALEVRSGLGAGFARGIAMRGRALLGTALIGAMVLAVACQSLHADVLADEATSRGPAKGAEIRAIRLSSVDGEVQVVQDGQVIADPATVNLPLFEGTQVITGEEGRAEIQLENGNVVRLSPNSALTLTVLQREGTGSKTELVLNGGLAYFELQPSTAENSVRVSYGPASFTASSFTVVRLTLDEAPGELAVFSGNIHLERGKALVLDVHGGESLTMGMNDATRYDVAETIAPNSWDSWNADRDQLLSSEAARKTAATAGIGNGQTPGMSDLDANGNWYNVPGEGYVWSPYEAAGADFDPYGFGSWASYPGYGYLFASGYGWGYAPYQCGLWNYYDNFGWGWAPGSGGCYPGYGYGDYGGYGGGGGGFNLGKHPKGYRPPRRPGPIHPRPVNGNVGGKQLAFVPVVPVDRRPPGMGSLALNGGSGRAGQYGQAGQAVTIGGHVVQPLGPLAPRQTYERSSDSFVNGSARPGAIYVPGGLYPGSSATPYHPAGGVVNRPSTASGSRPSGGGSSSAGAARSAPSAPSGGGSGGGHSSGGGGGGGGGGATHR